MSRVVLIAPKSKSKSASDISVLTTPLSGLLTLSTMLNEQGHEVTFFDESFKTPNYHTIDADYVLLSAMSATVNRAYDLADLFKEKGAHVIMGGLHVSFKAEEALYHCDTVVTGEGENTLATLLDSKNKKKIINGTPVKDLNTIPFPDYTLVEGMSKQPKIISICSSRGCPFNCRFCSLKNMFGQQFRSMDNQRVITYLQQFSHIKNLCFDEANFTANKQRVINLLRLMKEHSINTKYAWPSVSLEVAQNKELLKHASDIAQFHFLIGLESINKKVLMDYNKKHTPEKIKSTIKTLHDYGIKVHGSFIFGSDYDDRSVFERTVAFCHDADIDFPGFFPLTPYVGTDIRNDFEQQKRIITSNWDYYDGAHVVIQPKHMTPLELQQGIIDAFQGFYSTRKAIHHLFKGELYLGITALYFRHIINSIIKHNQEYLEFLEEFNLKKEKMAGG